MVSEEQVQRFIRVELDTLAASGYALARRIPSTYTWNIVDYVTVLKPAERDALFTAFSGNGLFTLFPNRNPDLHAAKAGDPAYRRFCEAMPLMGTQRLGVRLLRLIQGLRSSTTDRGKALATAHDDYSNAVLQEAESIHPTTATQIRKAVKTTLAKRFAAHAVNSGGGDWIYSGTHNGCAFDVQIDYGGRSDQLRYGVSYEDPTTGIRASSLTYEEMLGIGLGHWDYITATNLAESVELLSDLVKKLVEIPEKLRT